MPKTEWREKLDYAKTIADPLRRRFYVCALVAAALPQAKKLPYVIVGGNALEFYTLAYATVDVALVSSRRTERGVADFWLAQRILRLVWLCWMALFPRARLHSR